METPSLDTRVAAVRRFNRSYTRLIGLLDEGLLQSRFTLTEARVLYELAAGGVQTASDLGRHLDLDAGYLSRILQKFEQDGLIERRKESDRRQAAVRLTASGGAAFAPMDAGSRAQVRALLGALPEAAQDTLVQAMGRIERLLDREARPAPATIRRHQPGDIGWLVGRHGALYAAECGCDARFEALVAKVAGGFLETHDPTREACWIAEVDGVRLGSVMLVRETDTLARLRLLILEPEARAAASGARWSALVSISRERPATAASPSGRRRFCRRPVNSTARWGSGWSGRSLTPCSGRRWSEKTGS